ncbi:hypothetical protein GH714_015436 [Hevea brasiliensis]|uniref:HhH-GPD domain-containing protein n=1 Tax=Hevea brasiliensis TaxID=3981 RepID=A0A6A6LJL1_HEVBR|nr:hypothetical protein GH714_015436 [Hevea brasiliensis]
MKMQEYWIPETPAKNRPARPQEVYEQVKDQKSQNDGSLNSGSDRLIDLNKSICDWEDIGIDACGYKDHGDSRNSLREAALAAEKETRVQRGEPAYFIVNSLGYSGEREGDFRWQETTNITGDTMACTNNVVRSLDFRASGECLDEWNAPLDSAPSTGSLNCCSSMAPPAFQESEIATTQAEASQESPIAPIKDVIENLLPEQRNPLLSLDLEKGTSNPESHVTQCDQENEKVFLAPKTPVLKHNANKRPRKGIDVNQRPLSKIKKHRHRPKIAGQGKSKRLVKNSAENNKENNVRKTQSEEKKENREHASKNQSMEKKYVRKTESKKRQKPSTQQTSVIVGMQSDVGSFGGHKLLNDLDLYTNSFRWRSHGKRSVRSKIGFHRGSSWVQQLNFPKSCKRMRIKRQKKSVVSIMLGPLKIFNKKGSVNQKAGDVIEELIHKFKKLKISDISAIVPYQSSNSTKKTKPKVVLDSETARRWNLLMGIDNGACKEKVDEEKQKKWEEERKIFHGRVDSFTSKMHVVLGDRRFKPWKGSVVDSVVGVFLTQNVSDFLSSSAYMSLAAKFPVKPSNKEASVDDLENKNSQGSTKARQDSDGNQYFIIEPEPKTPADMVEETSLVDIEDLGNTALPQEYHRHKNKVWRCKNSENASRGMEHMNSISNSKRLNCLNASSTSTTPSDLDDSFEMSCSSSSACHKSYNFELMEGCRVENVVEEKMPEAEVEMKGNPHTRSELNETILKTLNLDFLNRVVDYHGSIDLEWLRYAPPDLVKAYLLEIPGLGLKSVECVQLLTLGNNAFPCVRMGPLGTTSWRPSVSSFRRAEWWKNVLHFMEVFCTKKNPNCGACPMRAECRHHASAVASANIALPPAKKGEERSIVPKIPVGNSALAGNGDVVVNPISKSFLESDKKLESELRTQNCEPFIEEPESPKIEQDIEELGTSKYIIDDEEEEIPTIKLNNDSFKENVQHFMDKYGPNLQTDNLSRALVPMPVNVNSIPMRKLKQTNRLRTEHQVYEIPDNHELLRGLEKRECDDSLPFLLAIWRAGETPDSCEPPKKRCSSQGPEICNDPTCFYCQSILEDKDEIVRGTILIPCRTAMRGRFPLNGTYFQVNEVFADHETSYNPVIVPRSSIWYLKRRTVYIGTSPSAIFRGGPCPVMKETCLLHAFVAIKLLKAQGGLDANSVVSKEVEALSRLSLYVVPLLGYCLEFQGKHSERLLVFEYMPNGNLRDCLDGDLGENMKWETCATPRMEESGILKSDLPHPRLKGNFPEEEMQIMAYLAKECLLLDPDARPIMGEVAQILSTIAPEKSRRRTSLSWCAKDDEAVDLTDPWFESFRMANESP